MSREPTLAALLARDALLAEVPPERLERLAARVADRRYADGEQVFAEDGLAAEVYFVLEGALQTGSVNGRLPGKLHEAPTYVGALAVLSQGTRPIGGWSVGESRMAVVPGDAFLELVREDRSVATEVFSRFGVVSQIMTGARTQREKLDAIGGLAAGLAHELNNPASAARRAASELRDAIAALRRGPRALTRLGLEPDQLATLDAAVDEASRRVAETTARAGGLSAADPLAAGDREEELAEWLEDRGFEDGWTLASNLSAAGVDRDLAASLAGALPEAALGEALRWLAAAVAADSLCGELTEATVRIDDLVNAVKDYSQLDQAPEQALDVHDGIESTLAVRAGRLAEVELVRDYDRDLPLIEARGAELNQVWTALIDNAVEAVAASPGRGRVELRTRRAGGALEVEVRDDGPGVPPDARSRVFEPFFTTKDVGSAGLGLDGAYRIVNGHGGSLSFQSDPGDTRFVVRLPLPAADPRVEAARAVLARA